MQNTLTVGCYTASRDDLPDGNGGVFSGTYTACDFYPPGEYLLLFCSKFAPLLPLCAISWMTGT